MPKFLNLMSIIFIVLFVTYARAGTIQAQSSVYGPWPNGPSQSPNFFALSVWWLSPSSSGSFPTSSGTLGFITQAQAASNTGVNIFLGFVDGNNHGVVDQADLAALTNSHVYGIAGIDVADDLQAFPNMTAWTQDVLTKAANANALGNLIGYNIGDEISCQNITSYVPQIQSVDNTRVINCNQFATALSPPSWWGGGSNWITQMQAVSIASADTYPATNPWSAQDLLYSQGAVFQKSDFQSVSNDLFWTTGSLVQGLAYYKSTDQPLWVYVDAGGDDLKAGDTGANLFSATVQAGSNIISNNSGWSIFTPTWKNLKVSGRGIAPGTTIVSVVPGTNGLQAMLSQAATASCQDNNSFPGSVVSGSNILTSNDSQCFSFLDGTWSNAAISGNGIPSSVVINGNQVNITVIIQPISATQAQMGYMYNGNFNSINANGTYNNETIYSSNIGQVAVTGGVNNSDCVAEANLCVVNGSEYRALPQEVNAEVWGAIINGANGIEYFCDDSSTDAFCLGDYINGGQASVDAQNNLKYINSKVLRFAPIINSTTTGMCSLQTEDYSTGIFSSDVSQCEDGILSLQTSDPTLPAMAMVKQYKGATFLFVESDRRSQTGATFTFTLSGLAGKTVTAVYDSNARYDKNKLHNGVKYPTQQVSNSGSSLVIQDALGKNLDHYQVKVYKIN